MGAEDNKPLSLTTRFTDAIDYAREIHTGTRKGTGVPYTAHLLGVASLVLRETGHVPFPVTEDMAIAALLHDAVDIEGKYGSEVAKIVEGCTDSFEEDAAKKKSWEERKQSYVGRVRSEPGSTLLVSIADKLYNARAIPEDYRQIGPKVWERFKRGRDQQLWYFRELLTVYDKRCENWRIVGEFRRTVAELVELSAGESNRR